MKNNLRILLLSSQSRTIHLVKEVVNNDRYQLIFTVARSHKEFLKKIKWSPYDLIIADQSGPQFSGHHAALFCNYYFSPIPFISLMSVHRQRELPTLSQASDACLAHHQICQLPLIIDQLLAASQPLSDLFHEQQQQQFSVEIQLHKSVALLDKQMANAVADDVNIAGNELTTKPCSRSAPGEAKY